MKRWQVNGLLFMVVMIWGSTFAVVRDAMDSWPPILFVALRFALASLSLMFLLVLRPSARRSWQRSDLVVGGLLGCLLFAGYTTQTMGLNLIPAARSGFITGLNVVMVPVLGLLLWRERIRLQTILGIGFAVLGLWVLTGDPAGEQQSWLGDGLTLTCAALFAGHILAIGRFAQDRSVWSLTLIQVLVVAVLAFVSGLFLEPWPAWSWSVVLAGLYLGSVATVGTLLLQTVAQRYASPTHTAMVFVLEPVFAALFAALFVGETLSMSLLLGGGCMLAGIILAELPPPARWKYRQKERNSV